MFWIYEPFVYDENDIDIMSHVNPPQSWGLSHLKQIVEELVQLPDPTSQDEPKGFYHMGQWTKLCMMVNQACRLYWISSRNQSSASSSMPRLPSMTMIRIRTKAWPPSCHVNPSIAHITPCAWTWNPNSFGIHELTWADYCRIPFYGKKQKCELKWFSCNCWIIPSSWPSSALAFFPSLCSSFKSVRCLPNCS